MGWGRFKIGCGRMTRENLERFRSVESWLKSVGANSRKGGLTPRNRRDRLGMMADFMTYIRSGPDKGMTPDDLLQEAREDLEKTKGRLSGYFQWLKGERVEGYEPRKVKISHNAALTNLGCIRGFFTHNGVGFGKWKMPMPVVSKARRADDQTPIYDYSEETESNVFRNDVLQHFLANLSFRDQVIALGLLSTSADAADLLKLDVGFVRGQKERRLFWHGNREKDLEEFKVLFSEEATRFLRQYVEQERKDAKDNDPLFMDSEGKRLNPHALAMNFRLAAEQMGYTNGGHNPFRPKRFRHLFRTACGTAGIDPGFTAAFMGHSTDVSGSYLEKPRGLFVKEYVKVEPFLTVFGKTGETERLTQRTRALEEGMAKILEDKLRIEQKLKELPKKQKELVDKRVEEKAKEMEKKIAASVLASVTRGLKGEFVVDNPELERQTRINTRSSKSALA